MAKARDLWAVSVVILLVAGCQSVRPAVSAWLAPDTPAWVHFPLKSDLETYAFSADPGAATILTVYSLSPELAYTAELRNGRGALVASLTGSVPTAALTIHPGSDVYQLTIKPGSAGAAGALSLTASSHRMTVAAAPTTASAEPIPVTAATFQPAVFNPPATCRASSRTAANVNVRAGPGLEQTVVGTLAPGSALDVTGRSANDWLRVTGGWVSGSVVALVGACDDLPLVRELAPFQLVVDRHSRGSFTDSLLPGDDADMIEVSVSNLLPQPPDNYGEFVLTVTCDGADETWARWGSPQNPAFPCDSSLILPFITGSSRQTFAVVLGAGAPGGIGYTLTLARR